MERNERRGAPWVQVAERERAKYFEAREAKKANKNQKQGEHGQDFERRTVVTTGTSNSALSSLSESKIFSAQMNAHLNWSSDSDIHGEPNDEQTKTKCQRMGHFVVETDIDLELQPSPVSNL